MTRPAYPFLRLCLLLVLVLALLPWGASARTYSHPVAVSAETALTADISDTAVSPARRCKGAALLGSPCGPDLALTTLPAAPQQHAGASMPFRAEPRLPGGRVVSGLKDPPILR